MGIRKDAHLVGQQYSWLTTCIYIAVLIVEYPTNWLIQRVPIAKYLGISIILWGTVLACHAACTNFTQLVVVRTLLGIFECVCQPAFLVLSAMWYKREEQAQTVAYWYMMNGGQQIVGGLLAYCFSLIKTGPLKSWQALFMTYGLLSILWGAFVIFWMPDSPMRAKCFSEQDKKLMIERVRSNQTGLQNKTFRSYQIREAFLDPQLYCYMLIAVSPQSTHPTNPHKILPLPFSTQANTNAKPPDLHNPPNKRPRRLLWHSSNIPRLHRPPNPAPGHGPRRRNNPHPFKFRLPRKTLLPKLPHHGPLRPPQLHRHNSAHDSHEPQHRDPSRPVNIILHRALVLGRANTEHVYVVAECGGPNEEDGCCGGEFRGVVCGQCGGAAGFFGEGCAEVFYGLGDAFGLLCCACAYNFVFEVAFEEDEPAEGGDVVEGWGGG